MKRAAAVVPAAVVLAAALGGGLAAEQSKTGGRVYPRLIFISVTGGQGAPVVDLLPTDFEISESGARRTVTRAALGTSPLRVIVVADTSDGAAPAMTQMRAGVTALVDALPVDTEVALVSTGRQTRVHVPPTADRKKVRDAAGSLFSDGGATVLEDTLLDMDARFVRKAENRWPVFVIVTGDGPEGSAGANEKKFNDWVVALPSRGISAHAIVMKFKGGGMPEVVANHVAVSAGGVYEFINTSNSLPDKMKAVGDRIAADAKQMSTWYEVEFQSEAAQPQPVDVGVARSGVKLQMSYQRHAQ